MWTAFLAFSGFSSIAVAQQEGKLEDGPQALVNRCDKNGNCDVEDAAFTLDASWRVQHNATLGGWQSCIIQDGLWQSGLCPDPLTCAKRCAIDGMSLDDYVNVHGISELEDGVKMNYLTSTQYGLNIGSRMYMLDEDYYDYKIFKLKNREFAFDIDASTLPCGVNAALYFVGMDKHGHRGRGNNMAGAKFGTGYCDAHCPHSSNFVQGEANMDWSWGSCCPEVDIFEGNSQAAAWTMHPCESVDFVKCTDPVECGDSRKGHHYEGICDKDGCDFNSYRMGDKDFFGENGVVKTSDKVLTVITQFITTDGTDTGDLKEIRRLYMQDGKVIQNSQASTGGIKGDSITDKFCGWQKSIFNGTRAAKSPKGNFDQFGRFGGMKKIGEALDKGMVMAVSLWDDPGSHMRWLDSVSPHKKPEVLGAERGPCDPETGVKHTRRMHQRAYVKFTNFIYGDIGATVSAYGEDRRLRRRFTQRQVRTATVPGKQHLPAAGMLLVGASSAILMVTALGLSRVLCRRQSWRPAAGDRSGYRPAQAPENSKALEPLVEQAVPEAAA